MVNGRHCNGTPVRVKAGPKAASWRKWTVRDASEQRREQGVSLAAFQFIAQTGRGFIFFPGHGFGQLFLQGLANVMQLWCFQGTER